VPPADMRFVPDDVMAGLDYHHKKLHATAHRNTCKQPPHNLSPRAELCLQVVAYHGVRKSLAACPRAAVISTRAW